MSNKRKCETTTGELDDQDISNKKARNEDEDASVEKLQNKNVTILDTLPNESSYSGTTILHKASALGEPDMVKLIIDQMGVKAEVDVKDQNGKTPLHIAAQDGHAGLVRLLVEKGASLREKSTVSGNTPLHLAVINGHLEAVKVLVELGAPIDEKDEHGFTPLYNAVMDGFVEGVEFLLAKGANAEERDALNTSMFVQAVLHGQAEIARLLYKAGANTRVDGGHGISVLHIASATGHAATVAALLELGMDPNIPAIHKKHTPLQFAAMGGNAHIVKFLCEHGAEVDAQDSDGLTALHLVTSSNNKRDVMVALAECGADPEILDVAGCTPLQRAVVPVEGVDGEEIVRNLVQVCGASVEGRSRQGFNALHLACSMGNVQAIRTLLKLGAEINSPDHTGQTPLHHAVSTDQTSGIAATMELLLDMKADWTIEDDLGDTPVHTAAYRGQIEAMEILVKHGASIKEHNGNGCAAIHVALRFGHDELVKCLVEKLGGDVNEKTEKGEPVLFYAAEAGKTELCRLLVEKGATTDDVDSRKQTVLHKAALGGSIETFKTLLQLGARCDTQTLNVRTPVHSAAVGGHEKMIEYLVELGYDPKQQDDKGHTPLHNAANNKHSECVRLLVTKYGSNVESKNVYDFTPLMVAANAGDLETVRKLLDFGAEKEVQDVDGCTALFHAAEQGNAQVVELLAERGANINTKDKSNATPLSISSNYGFAEAVKVLLKRGAGDDFVAPVNAKMFAQNASEDCSVCYEKCNHPIEFACKHSFCWPCVVGMQASGINKCPNCRGHLRHIIF